MNIYLAGPMRGYDQFNFPAFHSATQDLRNRGHFVHSPAEHDEASGFDPTLNTLDNFDLQAAFAWDIEQVLWCDALVMLPGWHASQGSNIEVSVGRAVGKRVLAYSTDTLVEAGPEDVTVEANRIVNGHRREEYGHPYDNFKRIGKMWGVILGLQAVSPYEVGMCMVALKLCREINSPTRDGRVDIAGYAETLEVVARRMVT